MNQKQCSYPPCKTPLKYKSMRALYCSRAHKELAKQIRDRQKVASLVKVVICVVCGNTFLANFRRGRTPKYCRLHQPKQPCVGCQRTLRPFAASRFCRICWNHRIDRHPQPVRVWTRICDVCSTIFEGSPSANLCKAHDGTKKDRNNL